jgi:hypothetical protein
MKINKNIENLIAASTPRLYRRMMFLMYIVIAGGLHHRMFLQTGNMVNAPPQLAHGYGSRYGLWRLWGKPVPIRTTRFRRT